MKIGYIMQEGVEIRHPPFNGPANHVREVVKGLSRRGHQVRTVVRVGGGIWRTDDLATFQAVTVALDRGARRLLERGIRRMQWELRLPYAALFESLRFAAACVNELEGYDLLYERFGWVGYGGGLAARRLGVPIILEDNGDGLFDLEAKGIAPAGLQRRLSMNVMRRAVRRAAHVVSSGAGWREQFIKRWDYDGARVTTVENGTALVDILRREQLKSFAGGSDPGAPPTLVYLGGFYPWHGVSILFRAFSQAIEQGTRARLLMIGSGDGFAGAKRMAEDLNLSQFVTFVGQLPAPEYAPLLAGADIGLSPYNGWPEFSGLKVLDYKAAGLPTIASGVNGHPSTLKSGKTGLIVPPGHVDMLREAIVRLCADAPLRARMGRAAREEAEEQHRWEHTAERLEALFLRVLAKSDV